MTEEVQLYNNGINIAGSCVGFLPNALPPDYATREALPEVDELTPLILQAREARAQGVHALRGLWHSASLRISPDGTVQIPADWDAKPEFERGPKVTRSDIEVDLVRFPRSPRWYMAWMDELL